MTFNTKVVKQLKEAAESGDLWLDSIKEPWTQNDLNEALRQIHEELERDPVYINERETAKQRHKDMREFKKRNPLNTILKTNPCKTCIVDLKCEKSVWNKSACRSYRIAITKTIKEKGWDKHGRRKKD